MGRGPQGGRQGRHAQRVDPAAQPRRHDLHDLGERADGGLVDAGDAALGGGPQADRERDGLVVVDHERREGGAGGELVAAGDAARRIDRVAEVAQPVDVAPQGARRDPEAVGELLPGQ